jgi:hypothetical protein
MYTQMMEEMEELNEGTFWLSCPFRIDKLCGFAEVCANSLLTMLYF